MFGTQGKTAGFMRFVGMAFLFYVGVWMWIQVSAGIEQQRVADLRKLDQSIDPVGDLVLDKRDCIEGGFVVSGLLDKTKYPNGREAEYIAMLIYDVARPPSLIPWGRTVESSNPPSRRYGEQSIDFIIYGPCDVVFTADTRHESPLTGDIRAMRWGPFYPPE